MVQHEGNGLWIKPGVERIEHRARHRHAKMRLHHRRGVGQHHRHRIVLANAMLLQGAGQLPAARIGLRPGLAQFAVDDGQPLRVDLGGAGDKAQRCHRRMVGPIAGEPGVKNAAHGGWSPGQHCATGC